MGKVKGKISKDEVEAQIKLCAFDLRSRFPDLSYANAEITRLLSQCSYISANIVRLLNYYTIIGFTEDSVDHLEELGKEYASTASDAVEKLEKLGEGFVFNSNAFVANLKDYIGLMRMPDAKFLLKEE